MSSLPGLKLEDYLAWEYDLTVTGQEEANISLGIAEALGTVKKARPTVSQEKFKELVNLHEHLREKIEDLLADFDEDTQSWRDYAQCFDVYIDYSTKRKSKTWMINQGFWKPTKFPVITTPDEYPLLIAGPGNTHKTTIALLIAYQEALLSLSFRCKTIVLISNTTDAKHVPGILAKFIPGLSVDDFYTDATRNKISFVFSSDINADIPGPLSDCVFIIDDPEIFIATEYPGLDHRKILSDKINFLTQEGAKVITCCHVSRTIPMGLSDSGMSGTRTIVRDEGIKDYSKTFIITACEGKEELASSPNKVIYLEQFPISVKS